MDTISRENNSMLPVGGIIVGVIALLLGGYSAITLSKVNKSILAHDEKIAKIDGIEAQVGTTTDKFAKIDRTLTEYANQTSQGFQQLAKSIGDLQGAVTVIQEAAKKPAPVAAGKKGGEPAVAGPGEYVVKAKETGAIIARNNGVALADLIAVNPGVNWNKLQPGNKVKLPLKK